MQLLPTMKTVCECQHWDMGSLSSPFSLPTFEFLSTTYACIAKVEDKPVNSTTANNENKENEAKEGDNEQGNGSSAPCKNDKGTYTQWTPSTYIFIFVYQLKRKRRTRKRKSLQRRKLNHPLYLLHPSLRAMCILKVRLTSTVTSK